MTMLMSACVVVVISMVAAINLALPELAASNLRPSSAGLLWIVDAYILTFGCFLIPAGALADLIGRKHVLLVGLGTGRRPRLHRSGDHGGSRDHGRRLPRPSRWAERPASSKGGHRRI